MGRDPRRCPGDGRRSSIAAARLWKRSRSLLKSLTKPLPRPASRRSTPASWLILRRLGLPWRLWPPPQPLVPPELLAAIRPDPFIISEAAKGTYIDARNKRILEDRRQIEEAERSQREFEAKGRRG
jgi:hypothetical protein